MMVKEYSDTDCCIANDPAPIPIPSPTHGSYHWAFERQASHGYNGRRRMLMNCKCRIIAIALVPLTVAPFAAGTLNPIMDAILCATILIHSHIGFE